MMNDNILIPSSVKVISFDADDTLWENEPLFLEAEALWADVLSPYGTKEELSARLFEVESANMEDFGYGAKAFTLSLIQSALEISGGKVSSEDLVRILSAGRRILHNPASPIEGVAETLETIRRSGRYFLVLMTKGDLLDQQHKLQRSALGKYFDRGEIVSGKTEKEYSSLLSSLEVPPSAFLSVGNSFRSDIAPVLQMGGWGVYVPFRVTWEHEKVEEYPHDRLFQVDKIGDILPLLGL